MIKFLLKTFYALICIILLILLKFFFGIEGAWWIEVIIIGFGLFIGAFIYTQLHGTQVMELRHLADTKVNKFQVSFRISGQGILNVIGKYERVNPYTDLELQRKLFRTLNAFPGSKWIREFVLDKTSTNISITVDDQELPHPINFTRIQIEKILELS